MKDKEYKTIQEVLDKGYSSVNLPVTAILVIIPIASIFVLPTFLPDKYAGLSYLIAFIVCFVLAWLYWSYKIVKWRIWAFENTRESDWITLRQKAVEQQLIWSKGSIFEKTEIRSKKEREQIENIDNRIQELIIDLQEEPYYDLDEIKDDSSIPPKTDYYYHRMEITGSIVVPLIFIAGGIFLIYKDNLVIGLLGIGFSIYNIDRDKIKNIWKREVQLSLSNEGIYINGFKQFDFVPWDDTQDIYIDTVDGILRMGVWVKEDYYDVTVNLKDYYIANNNYNELLRKVNIYLKRNQIRNEKT